ncbi:MAG: hypothetical protein K2H89_11800 [Oscillospiraceae bacterium]|nr:hypothetical protein [Oscillospiraceae bacterium]
MISPKISMILAVLAGCLSICILGTGCSAELETESIPEETAPVVQTTAESEMTTVPETTTEMTTTTILETTTTSTTETTTTTELPETTTETTTTTIPETDPPTEAPTIPPTDPPTEAPTIPPTDPPVIAEQPDPQPVHFILNTDTNCVHINPGCRAAEKILPENYAEIDIWEEDLPNYAYVYWACGICTKSYTDQLPKF